MFYSSQTRRHPRITDPPMCIGRQIWRHPWWAGKWLLPTVHPNSRSPQELNQQRRYELIPGKMEHMSPTMTPDAWLYSSSQTKQPSDKLLRKDNPFLCGECKYLICLQSLLAGSLEMVWLWMSNYTSPTPTTHWPTTGSEERRLCVNTWGEIVFYVKWLAFLDLIMSQEKSPSSPPLHSKAFCLYAGFPFIFPTSSVALPFLHSLPSPPSTLPEALFFPSVR